MMYSLASLLWQLFECNQDVPELIFPENVFPLLELDVKALEDEELKKFAKNSINGYFFYFCRC